MLEVLSFIEKGLLPFVLASMVAVTAILWRRLKEVQDRSEARIQALNDARYEQLRAALEALRANAEFIEALERSLDRCPATRRIES